MRHRDFGSAIGRGVVHVVAFSHDLFPGRDGEVTIARMSANAIASDPATAIWLRVMQMRGDLSAVAAPDLLKWLFSYMIHEPMGLLSAKAEAGAMTAQA